MPGKKRKVQKIPDNERKRRYIGLFAPFSFSVSKKTGRENTAIKDADQNELYIFQYNKFPGVFQ